MLDAIMAVTVKRACSHLADGELAALNNVVQADFDPTGYSWYEKVAYLFTEKDGTRMRSVTKDVLSKVVLARLYPAAAKGDK